MPTPTYELVDRVLDGNLAATLDTWRSDGLSFERIARRLEADHGVSISAATICRWLSTPTEPEPAK